MKCPKCRFDNPENARFCNECGVRIEATCRKCGRANPGGSRFCNHCGAALVREKDESSIDYLRPESYTPAYLAEKILTSRSSIEGEKKQVTVLFCDITNSTSMAEKIGSEAFHNLVNRFFELCLAEVHTYEGTINQFLGDGFMALFGAPIACEDHGRRAVLAAEGINKKIAAALTVDGLPNGPRLKLRMGINTGTVVVGAIGDNLRMDYTAVGDTTNIAARLQQAAAPRQVLLSGATRHAVRGYYRLAKVGDLRLKGKREKVAAWEVASERGTSSRHDPRGKTSLTPFVGRGQELETLKGSFENACSGLGQVVSLIGEAGIGKSRLLLEFRRSLGEKDAKWLEGRAVSFGKLMAFHPLIDLFKRNYRIEESDTEDEIVEKINRGVRSIGEELEPILPYLRYLLTLDSGDPAVQNMAPKLRHREIFRSLRDLLVRASALRPQVLVFEDLHWFDQATEESLIYLANSIHHSRVLVICTYRPGYTNPIGDRPFHVRIVLSAISAADSLTMTRAMLAAADLPATLQRLIVERSEGNPLFVEEVVKSMREDGTLKQRKGRLELSRSVDDLHVPASIQDVLMTRIDRLAEAVKRTLQVASVIGREFSFRLLSRLSQDSDGVEAHLQALEHLELIEFKQLFPEQIYQFSHALTQEVAYRSLLRQRRSELHRRIGRLVEKLYPDRLEEFYEVLAYHFTRGEQWRNAMDYYTRAGDKAGRAFAIRDAIALYDKALEAADRVEEELPPRGVMELYRKKSELYYGVSEFEKARMQGERLLQAARRSGDRMMEGMAQSIMGWAATYAHEFDQALEDAENAISIGRETRETPVLARGHMIKGHVYYVTGRIHHAKSELDRAMSLSRSAGDEIHQAMVLRITALGKSWEGRYDEGAEQAMEGIRIAKQHNLVMVLIQLLWTHGILSIGKGEYRKAHALLGEGLELAEKAGEEAYHFRILNGIGWLFSECGDLSKALEYNGQSAEQGRKRGDPEIIANAELNLADVYMLQGEYGRAHRHLHNIFRIASNASTSRWMQWRYTIHLLAAYAEFWLARGDLSKAESLARRCLQQAEKTASRKYRVKGLRVMGEISSARGDLTAARGWLGKAVSSARSLGNPTQLYRSCYSLGRLQDKTGERDLARKSYAAARRIVAMVNESLSKANLNGGFERLPIVEKINHAASGR